ncbi:MAG: exopolysaccharide biosynthesis polyprenyl glycosylphosphotransferase [Roseiflexaceae bacterium]
MTTIDYRYATDQRAARMRDLLAGPRLRYTLATARMRCAALRWSATGRARRWLKRTLDLSAALVLLALAAPLMLLTALLIRLESPGPVLFRQTRTGRWGRPFTCFKFRSMYVDAERRLEELRRFNEADGPVFKMKNDPRITRVGRVIRKLSIDELPQLFNVLRGDMSLVGPRPALPREVACYTYDQARRLDVTPGITGLQQVSGRSDIDFERWIALDLQYINEQGVAKDIEILLRTIPAVLFSKGAY